MKFTIERQILIHLIKHACGPLRTKRAQRANLSLSACAARVFIAGPAAVAGYEALVFSDGECQVPAGSFLAVLKSYPDTTNVTIEVDEHGLRLERFIMPAHAFSPRTVPPARFQVFPVTDLHVLGAPHSPA